LVKGSGNAIPHRKHDNNWFFDEDFKEDGMVVPQVLPDESIRQKVLRFFRTLPIALERDDLRVIHACWHDDMIDCQLPPDATPLPFFHVTLIGRKVFLEQQDAMANAWESVRPTLPFPPLAELDSSVNEAVDEYRKTWFLHIVNQNDFRHYVEELTTILDDAFRRLSGHGFANPSTDRYFHMSVGNNRGGDPLESIGSIRPS
jgi:hypothetical protein